MKRMYLALVPTLMLLLSACGSETEQTTTETPKQDVETKQPEEESKTPSTDEETVGDEPETTEPEQDSGQSETDTPSSDQDTGDDSTQGDVSSTKADLSLGVLVVVNKQLGLEPGYRPSDLVEPNIPFVESATGERRTLRREAAAAVEELFEAAAAEGINIKATSAFRSYEYQEVLFNAYVERDGKEAALRYSAPPGHSEHQTGLTLDVSGQSVGYELTQQLGEMVEGKWLAENAHRFGFIVRYERAFEAETGYMYEPWHLRYVGKKVAADVVKQGVPFDRYMGQ